MWLISKRDSIYKDVAYIWLPWWGIYKQAPSSPALAYAQARADGTDCEHESHQRVLGTNNTLNCPWAWEPCTSSMLLLLLLPVQTAGGLVLLALFRFPHVKVNLSSTPPPPDTMLQPHVWMRVPGQPDHLLLSDIKYFMHYLLSGSNSKSHPSIEINSDNTSVINPNY